MSIGGAWCSAINGMNAFANMVGNVSDNLANVGTYGYKRADSYFQSLLMGPVGNYSDPVTVRETPRFRMDLNGNIAASDNPTSFAISNGSGFVQVRSLMSDGGLSSKPFYTRACDFSPNGSGYLVNSGGQALMAVAETTPFSNVFPTNPSSSLIPVIVPHQAGDPYYTMPGGSTSTVSLNANFPANATVTADPITGGPAAGSSPNDQTLTMQIYDSAGAVHTMQVIFRKTAPNTWETIGGKVLDQPPVQVVPPGGPFQTFTFDSNGQLGATTKLNFDIPDFPSGASIGTLTLDLGTPAMNSTQYSGTNLDIRGIVDVTGHPPGTLLSATVEGTGVVDFRYSNGVTMNPYRVPLATFNNPDRLDRETGAAFSDNPSEAGSANYTWPGDGGNGGSLISNAVEQSNVDISTELVKMLQAQQAYSSNSKVITISDQMTVTAIGLKA